MEYLIGHVPARENGKHMPYVNWQYETLNKFCDDVFRTFGFSEEDSAVISDVLLTADLYGIESHGMQLMVRYHKGIE